MLPLYTQPKRPGQVEEGIETGGGVSLAPSTWLIMLFSAILLWQMI